MYSKWWTVRINLREIDTYFMSVDETVILRNCSSFPTVQWTWIIAHDAENGKSQYDFGHPSDVIFM